MAQKPDLWMPLYLGAYIADTMRFTTEQHGAYLLLIMDYWRNGPPPDDDKVLAQIAKLPLARWKTHRGVIAPKFQIFGGVWKHKRVEHELGRAREMQGILSERGKAGAAARWNKDTSSNATGNATGNARAMLADAPGPLPRPLQTPGPLPGPRPLPQSQKQPPSDAAGAAPAAEKPKRGNGKAKAEPPTRETWAAYASAYQQRYGVEPMRNAKVNGMVARFCERIPLEEAPQVAAFFVRSNRGLYVSAKHAVDLLLRDAEALRTEWVTGHQGTETQARQTDQTAAAGNVWGKLISEAEEREKLDGKTHEAA